MIRSFKSTSLKNFEKILSIEVLSNYVIEIIGIVGKRKNCQAKRELFFGYEPIDYHKDDGSVIHYNEDMTGYFNKGQFYKFA
jgi:hypothetical protein